MQQGSRTCSQVSGDEREGAQTAAQAGKLVHIQLSESERRACVGSKQENEDETFVTAYVSSLPPEALYWIPIFAGDRNCVTIARASQKGRE